MSHLETPIGSFVLLPVPCRAGSVSAWSCTLLLTMSLTAAIGCGSSRDDRVAVYPVEGAISFGGQSLEGAFVVLHPEDVEDPRALPARGYVDHAGKFTLTTYEAGDGAAEGEYRVTVVHTPLVQRDGDVAAGPNVLPAKYATPRETSLRVRVAAGPNSLPALELQR
jgi:hypothetical protein